MPLGRISHTRPRRLTPQTLRGLRLRQRSSARKRNSSSRTDTWGTCRRTCAPPRSSMRRRCSSLSARCRSAWTTNACWGSSETRNRKRTWTASLSSARTRSRKTLSKGSRRRRRPSSSAGGRWRSRRSRSSNRRCGCGPSATRWKRTNTYSARSTAAFTRARGREGATRPPHAATATPADAPPHGKCEVWCCEIHPLSALRRATTTSTPPSLPGGRGRGVSGTLGKKQKRKHHFFTFASFSSYICLVPILPYMSFYPPPFLFHPLCTPATLCCPSSDSCVPSLPFLPPPSSFFHSRDLPPPAPCALLRR
eukprot:Hpha_TRINITY_DN14068_c0_g1::TRINITY_DN14068_c0_g1_i2::g.43969::m.43969